MGPVPGGEFFQRPESSPTIEPGGPLVGLGADDHLVQGVQLATEWNACPPDDQEPPLVGLTTRVSRLGVAGTLRLRNRKMIGTSNPGMLNSNAPSGVIFRHRTTSPPWKNGTCWSGGQDEEVLGVEILGKNGDLPLSQRSS